MTSSPLPPDVTQTAEQAWWRRAGVRFAVRFIAADIAICIFLLGFEDVLAALAHAVRGVTW